MSYNFDAMFGLSLPKVCFGGGFIFYFVLYLIYSCAQLDFQITDEDRIVYE